MKNENHITACSCVSCVCAQLDYKKIHSQNIWKQRRWREHVRNAGTMWKEAAAACDKCRRTDGACLALVGPQQGLDWTPARLFYNNSSRSWRERERRRGGEGRGGGVSVDHTLAFKGITELWAHGSAWALWSTLTTNPVTLSFTKSPASSLRATQARTCGCMTQPAAWLSNNGGCVVNQSLLCWDDPRLFVLVRSQSSCLEPILPKFTITAAQSMWAITLPSGNCFKNVRNEFLSCVFCPPHLHLLLLQLQVIITQTCEHQVSQSKHYKAFKQGKTHRTRAAAFHSL